MKKIGRIHENLLTLYIYIYIMNFVEFDELSQT